MLKKCGLLALLTLPCWSQTNTTATPTNTTTPPEMKPYDQVITSKAKTQSGLFKVHQVGEKFYYEIPKNQLDRDFLMVVTVARGKIGTGDGGGEGLTRKVVRWHRQDRRILLQEINYSLWADPKLPIAQAVAEANNPTILGAYLVESESDQHAPVIEVTKLFNSELIEFSPRYLLGAKAFDQNRSFVERISAYPENIEAESTLTMTNADARWNPGEMYRGSASLRMHYSMVKLPEQPMKPRLIDSRVGYFSTNQTDYGTGDHFVKEQEYLARWRLDKKEPGAALSEPVKPIVFYIDPATPAAWVPYVKKGVEQWQPAFEAAGFKNAILALEAPKDGSWSIEDARFSTIRWVASETPNAYGPHISDPRTGEILEADIHMFHNILDLQRRWYFTQVAHLDPRAQRLPMPDDLMGQLIEFVVAHEVGHSLGFQHNMRGSSTYTLAQVRDPQWVRKMGHTPSIMDYSRFNYVAQPEDKIAAVDLIPKVGPYDKFAVHWGYAPIPGASTPQAEKRTLDEWARQQDTTPWLRFSNMDSMGADPGDQTEAVGDQDPVAATRLGIKNLKRTAALLLSGTEQMGEDYSELRHFRNALFSQWGTECNHVIALVGGVHMQDKHFGQSGVIYHTLPKKRQQEAVDFLLKEVMVGQDWLLDPGLVRLLQMERSVDQVAFIQRRLLSSLCSSRRLNRMAEQGVYSVPELLTTVRHGVFSELAKGQPVSLQRRMVQKGLSDILIDLSYSSGEARNHGLRQMRLLDQELAVARKRYKDENTLAHIDQLQDDLHRELDPRANGRRGSAQFRSWGYTETPVQNCWSDSGAQWLLPDEKVEGSR
jgi:hypothetical protein